MQNACQKQKIGEILAKAANVGLLQKIEDFQKMKKRFVLYGLCKSSGGEFDNHLQIDYI
ncbi:hypothetical protein [Fibrobacter sp. UWR2]|uniref:hypothetical protein n=1 Tax=Fibrobacter sp. UWR2 TaxID=1964352 RepID=UPI001303562F|nr:hypothetical protein [Fibrobacter sp. UWR2]